MSSIQFFNYFQIFFSLIVASLITYRIRKPIRAMIVQMMPVKKRISEDFFHIQTRIGAVVGIVVATIIALLLYFTLEAIEQPFTKKTVQESFTPVLPIKRPVPESSNMDEELKRESLRSSPEEDLIDAPNPNSAVDLDTKPNNIPVDQAKMPDPPIREYGDWYLQLNAFSVYDNAIQQYDDLRQRLQRSVWIAIADGEEAPYKVLIGPFPDRQALKKYQNQHQLTGWPRKSEGLRFERGGR